MQKNSRLARLVWLSVAVFTVHNLEEVIGDFSGWGQAHFAVLQHQPEALASNYDLIIIGLTLAVLLYAWVLRKNTSHLRRVLPWFASIMIVVSLWHIGVSLWAGSAQPGVWTAAFLNLPCYVVVLLRMQKNKATT